MRSQTLDKQVGTGGEPQEPLFADASEVVKDVWLPGTEPKDGEDQPGTTVPPPPTDEPLRLFATAWELLEAGRLSLAFQLAKKRSRCCTPPLHHTYRQT